MNRRELLQRVAWLMGGAISAPAVLGVLNGCSPKPSAGWQPLFLSKEEGAMVEEVAELIMPRTDTPGARDVGVPAFIDVMLKDAYPTRGPGALRQRPEGFRRRKRSARTASRSSSCSRRSAWRSCRRCTTRRLLPRRCRRTTTSRPRERKRPFVLMMKELTLLGFFTSQVGATQVLQYVAVPGGFQACIPIAKPAMASSGLRRRA